jgi:hypothetical protein
MYLFERKIGYRRSKAPQVGLEPTTLRLTATQLLGNDEISRIAKEIAGVF